MNKSDSFDVLLISQWRSGEDVKSQIWFVDFQRTVNRLRKYMESHGSLRVAVALVGMALESQSVRSEKVFFAPLAELGAELCERVDPLSTYRLMDKSQIVLSSTSTIGLESLGVGKRTLITDPEFPEYVRTKGFDPSLFTLCSQSQGEFNRQVDTLLDMSDWTFASSVGDVISFLMKQHRISIFRTLVETVQHSPEKLRLDE